jgi:hypothetical protein
MLNFTSSFKRILLGKYEIASDDVGVPRYEPAMAFMVIAQVLVIMHQQSVASNAFLAAQHIPGQLGGRRGV